MFVDTDVLIWYMRGNERAKEVLEAAAEFSISVVTYMELLQGARDKRELTSLRSFVHERGVNIVQINENISERAAMLVETLSLSSSLCLADALIAATAIEYAPQVMTGNDKHYAVIDGLEIQKFRP